jgi:hypothetical protein
VLDILDAELFEFPYEDGPLPGRLPKFGPFLSDHLLMFGDLIV